MLKCSEEPGVVCVSRNQWLHGWQEDKMINFTKLKSAIHPTVLYMFVYTVIYVRLQLWRTLKWSSLSASSFPTPHVAGRGITNFFVADARDLTPLLFIVVSSSVSAILIFFWVFLGAVEWSASSTFHFGAWLELNFMMLNANIRSTFRDV